MVVDGGLLRFVVVLMMVYGVKVIVIDPVAVNGLWCSMLVEGRYR